MTSNPCPLVATLTVHRSSAGVLAASIAAAAIVGLLALAQSAPIDAQSATPAGLPRSDAAEALDSGVDWSRVECAQERDGASVAAYER